MSASAVAVLAIAALVIVAVLIALATPLALRRRRTFQLLAVDGFDPKPDEMARFAAGLWATHRGAKGLFTSRAEAVRFTLSADGTGTARTLVCVPSHAVGIVESHLPAGVEMRPVDEPMARSGNRYRAEMRLAELSQPVGVAPLPNEPDPLVPLVSVLGGLGTGESGGVVLDLRPVKPNARRQALKRAIRNERGGMDGLASSLGSAFGDPLVPGPGKAPSWLGSMFGEPATMGRMEERALDKHRHGRLSSGEAMFSAQVMVWADAVGRKRARQVCRQVCAGLVSAGLSGGSRNRWRVSGTDVGVCRIGGAQSWWRRAGFDYRLRSGWFRPPKPSVVLGSEVSYLLRPPVGTMPNVERSGGVVSPAPLGLQPWEPGLALWPLGEVTYRGVPSVVGLDLKDSLFSLACGRAGHGKSQQAEVRAIALAQVEPRIGVLYLDPHRDALDEMLPYFASQSDRLAVVDLDRGGETQTGWNLLEMTGLDASDIEARVSLVTSSMAAAAGWTERTGRALGLCTMTAQSLCELNLSLPPECQATLFQMTSMLTDQGWRERVTPHLTPATRAYWANEFDRLAKEATGPITQVLNRLRAVRHVAALFGQSRSTYSLRSAMDRGDIVLICPGGGGEPHEKLLHAVFMHDIFRSTLSRRDTPAAMRREVHAFIDEVQVGDSGYASDSIERILREGRKFGLRLHAMTQQPTVLQKDTLNAMLTNRSHLTVTAMAHDDSARMAKEMPGDIEPSTISGCERYHFLASVNLNGRSTPAFRVRGLSVTEAFGPRPVLEPGVLEAAIDANMGRRPVPQVLAEMDTLPKRIVDALGRANGTRPLVDLGKDDLPAGVSALLEARRRR